MRWGNAFIVKNGDRCFLFSETGDLIIAKLTPEKYQEISRAHLLAPTNPDPKRLVVWSHPAFANRSVYARNDQEIVCDGRHVRVTLNGVVIVDADLDKVQPIDGHEHPGLTYVKGHIGLHAHGNYGAKVYLRNLRVKELP